MVIVTFAGYMTWFIIRFIYYLLLLFIYLNDIRQNFIYSEGNCCAAAPVQSRKTANIKSANKIRIKIKNYQ